MSRREHEAETVNLPDTKDTAPEGVMTRARVAPPDKGAPPEETVNLISKSGTKVTAPAHMAEGLKAQGYK